MRPKKKQLQSKALRYVYDRYVGDHPKRIAAVQQQRMNLDIACQIYALRTKAGLTQSKLAKRVGTSASAICRLEDAEYEGHSLSMLRRIAAALESRIEIRFVPLARKRQPA